MTCLHTLISEQAQRTPNAPAVVDDHRAISYAELDSKSDRMARHFVSLGLECDDTVGLYMPKSVDYIVGCLAALKAGGAFLPLFLDYPESLLGKVLEQTQTKIVLTTQDLSAQLNAPEATVLEMDNLGDLDDEHPLPEVESDNLMFVVYTSGTTGEPKGIQLPHRAALHSYAERRKISSYQPGQRVACNIFFVWEAFRPLLRGAAIHVISDDIIYDPRLLSDFLRTRQITEVLFTPSLMETMLNHLPARAWKEKLSCLQVIWLNGEVVTEKLRSKALAHLPEEVRLLNTYSISECHDVASMDLRKAETSGTDFCRVGYPIDGISVFCMGENGQPVPSGESGELFVGGPGLARGYLGKPHLTAERFVHFEGQRLYRTGDIAYQYPDGLLEIRGRCDSMVKIRGYSVHLGAVQSCLERLKNVKSASVIAVGEEGRDKRLVAYVVGHPQRAWKIDPVTGASPVLREQLREHLAEFMLPNHFMELDQLPLSPTTGKLDTKLLPRPPERQVFDTDDLVLDKEATYEDKEHLMAQLWERLLGLDPGVVRSDSNFFDLGAHSLMAVRATVHIERIMGFSLSVKQLYTYPTVKQLTQFLHTGHATISPSDLGPQPEDWRLPEAVRPSDQPSAISPSRARAIFLTGATGFLGGFILSSVLKSSTCPIYCLVRPGKLSAQERLEQNLKSYGLELSGRIRAISGDLSQESFGLKPDDYELLCREVDVIFHCGAAVNYVHNYTVLKPHTVGGTLEVLKLCCRQKAKTLHYVSTNGVFPGGDTYLENPEIDGYLEGLGNGYGHSKWVAEKLVWQAVERGLHATLYRPGNIGHHTQSGAANPNDFQYLLVRACLAIKAIPQVEGWFFEMTPVDFLSQSLVSVAESCRYSGRVFNVVQRPTTPAQEFFSRLQTVEPSIRSLSLEDWTEALAQFAQQTEDSKLEVLANSLPDIEGYLKDTSCYDSQQFQSALCDLGLSVPEAGFDYLSMLVKERLEATPL